jgi:hypothetical protein
MAFAKQLDLPIFQRVNHVDFPPSPRISALAYHSARWRVG